ncbi:phage portal protein [Pseudorhodoferax sp. Leaf274]|uniref:phage portal protein n=1 Tax=Pseudorhodoferax sp. Leaf274 TaxID=1736318 RepID=UPI0007037D1B|nr:phage portal protein [Pseudorhodoferax sp. Leaf274]KQP43917.1 hypothetical protein ASF44_28735 [Pseudorhodoferax sp. Leaf274]
MNVFARVASAVRKAAGVLAPVASGRGGWFPLVREPYAGAWQRNQELSQDELVGSPMVYACMTRISNDIGKLRARLVEIDALGIWNEVERKSPHWQVLRKPNRYQNHVQFKQWWVMSKLRSGNTYGLKERDSRGIVIRIYVLDPSRVTPLVADDGSVFYQLAQDNLAGLQATSVTVPASEIIHDRMNCLYHPLVGISPLYAAALAAGVGVKIQGNTAQFFGNRSTPGGILVAPGPISKDNAQALKEAWDTGYTGANAGKVAVLGDGLKFEPMHQTASDSQLVETLRWTDERVCSVFHMPAYKVGVGAAPSFNNIEALDRGYYSGCLQSLIEEMEACWDDGLGHDGVSIGVELDLNGLMRMDTKTQYEALGVGTDKGLLAINEGRRQLNLPPLKGGDTVYMQQQDYPLDQVRHNKIPTDAPPPAPPPAAPPEPSDDADDIEDAAKVLAAFMTKELHDAEY